MTDKLDDLLTKEDTGNNNVTPLAESKTKEKEEETVVLTKDQYGDLLKRLTRMEKTADKKRLTDYDRLNDEDPETIYKLRTIDGKVITHWSDLITNKAEVDPVTKKIVEDQLLTVYYEDKSSEDMQLAVFNRRYKLIFAKLISEEKLSDPEKKKKFGNRIFTVKTVDDDKEYKIGETFIN